MTIENELALSFFKRIGALNESHGVFLVQNIRSKAVFVEKRLVIYNKDVYLKLAGKNLRGLPKIEAIIEDDGVLTVIEEYISGRSLKDVLDESTLSVSDSVRLIIKLCDIVAELHSLDPPVIHRDIKPSNIIITADGDIRLIDLNAAKFQVDRTEKDTVLIGTQGYAAPEQYGFGSSGIWTDIYAIGVLLSTLIYGDFSRVRPKRTDLDNIIDKCTKIDPSMRYGSVDLLADALRTSTAAVEEHVPENDTSEYAYSFLPPGFRRKKPLNMVTAVIIYFLIALAAFTNSYNGIEGKRLILNKVFFFISLIAAAFMIGNYRNIWDKLHISRIKKGWLRYTVAVLASTMVFFVGITILVIIESIIWGVKTV